MLTGIEKALLAVLVLILMAGMGASLEMRSFRETVRKPRALLVGLASQFGWMPAIALGLAKVCSLPQEMAIGLLVVGCTPGGTTSNLFAYYAKADVALSIAMTVASTCVAIVLMPLLLGLYLPGLAGAGWLDGGPAHATLAVPYGRILQTLAAVVLPVLIGLWLRAKRPKAAGVLEKVGSYAGAATLVLLVASSLLRNGHLLAQTSPAMFGAAAGLGLFGLLLGGLFGRLLGLGPGQRRAVALETGIQNSPLAFAILVASFPESQHQALLWLPMLYALLVLVAGTLVSGLMRCLGSEGGEEAAVGSRGLARS